MRIETLDGTVLPDPYDELNALPEDVLEPTTFIGESKVKDAGKMINRGSMNPILSFGTTFTIPKGYHTGLGVITAQTLEHETVGSVTPNRMASGKTAWVNGMLVTGAVPVQTQTPAVVSLIYGDPTFYMQIPEGMYKEFANTVALKGSDFITVANINVNYIAQGQKIFDTVSGLYTSDATATADMIRSGKTAYVKGQKLTGTMTVPSLY